MLPVLRMAICWSTWKPSKTSDVVWERTYFPERCSSHTFANKKKWPRCSPFRIVRTRNTKHASYCVRCRKTTATSEPRNGISRNNRRMVRGRCRTCGSTNTKFVSGKVQKGGDVVNTLNTITRRVKLPWTKFPGEMHLPGHNFTGPATKLGKRLNADGTPKRWPKRWIESTMPHIVTI